MQLPLRWRPRDPLAQCPLGVRGPLHRVVEPGEIDPGRKEVRIHLQRRLIPALGQTALAEVLVHARQVQLR